MDLKDFRVLSFDCYGTLIDWEKGMLDALKPLTNKLDSGISENQILQTHAYFESEQQSRTPTKLYRDILAIVYRRMAEQWGIAVEWYDCMEYGKSIGKWNPFPDSVRALRYLKKHFKLVILSNVDQWSFSASNQKLGVEFDAILTAEEIGSYKPSHENFEFLVTRLEGMGFSKTDILHTAQSLYHDHVPAKHQGFKTCWIDRKKGDSGFGATPKPEQNPTVDYSFGTLADFVIKHKQEMLSNPGYSAQKD